ncbi:Tryprostatin B 6-hydroxylase, partial [Neolecta irregularis DAH-3]
MLVKSGKRHKHLKELHEKYGDFVRVGPNAVSICNVDAQRGKFILQQNLSSDIYGPSSSVIKSPGYDAFKENAAYSSLNNVRDHSVHRQLMKSMGPGFSHQTLAKLEFLVAQNAVYFCESVLKFGRNGEQALNLTTWTSFFTYDVMGDLCFGESYDLMKNGNMASLVLFATAPLKLAGLALASPFLAKFNAIISPKSLREGLALFRKAGIDTRLANNSGRKDFMHFMIAYADLAETKKDRRGRLQSNTETL